MKKILRKAAAVLFWLCVWIAAYFAINQSLLLPSPWQVARQMTMVASAAFWRTVAASLLRTMTAYFFGIALACILAIASSISKIFESIIRPAMVVIRATPVASFIILALVWLSASNVPVLAGMLMVIPVVYANIMEGISSTDPKLLEMARMFNFSRCKKWRHVIIPSVFPTFLAACKACVGLCFKATIAAEVIGIPKNAIGSQLHNSKVYLETDQLIAWTVIIIVLSVLIEKVISRLFERWIARVNHT